MRAQYQSAMSSHAGLTSFKPCFVMERKKPEEQQRYPGQRVLVVQLEGYVHLVPYVETAEHLFLKTIIPSRKAHRIYANQHPDNLQTEDDSDA